MQNKTKSIISFSIAGLCLAFWIVFGVLGFPVVLPNILQSLIIASLMFAIAVCICIGVDCIREK